MKQKELLYIAKLRISVAFLGELHQKAWWDCSFFSPSSTTFLYPVFGRTASLSRYYGAKEAATIVHDEHIGIGKGVYHLFRLPEAIERELHELLQSKDVLREISSLAISTEEAIRFLKNNSDEEKKFSFLGPVRITNTSDIDKLEIWMKITNIYYYAINNETKIFPYFSGAK